MFLLNLYEICILKTSITLQNLTEACMWLDTVILWTSPQDEDHYCILS